MNALPQELTRYTLYQGDCLEVMATLPAGSMDAVVTDPPYGLRFMNANWDHGIPGEPFWREALRVAKPGCHLLAFGGTRTFHRLMCAIEDAGWEIRDTLMWVYGSGFPKSMDVSKAIDKEAGCVRPRVHGTTGSNNTNSRGKYNCGEAISGDAKRWNGFGTALKPAWEPIILARKPLAGTVAANVLEYGTGALNIDGCRVGTVVETWPKSRAYAPGQKQPGGTEFKEPTGPMPLGRWPANLIHDGSEEVTELFPVTAPSKAGWRNNNNQGHEGWSGGTIRSGPLYSGHTDSGSAARFFKCCAPEEICPLCCMPYAEACDTIEAWKNTLASTAENRGWTSQATSEFIVRVNAIWQASERIAPHVKFAGSLCDSCATSIAVALVATKTLAFSSEELQVTLASIGSCNASILIQSLASFAELLENTDTIPTTTSLSLLFGYVRDAIANYTNLKRAEAEAQKSAPSRFAYVPKASKADRDEGCEEIPEVLTMRYGEKAQGPLQKQTPSKPVPQHNHHPTVKPTDLMRYICRLVTPPGGVVLDPFAGSGSTGKAALLEGFHFLGIEREPEYLEIARARLEQAACEMPLLRGCE